MNRGVKAGLAAAVTTAVIALAAMLPAAAPAGLTTVLVVNNVDAVAIPNGSGAAKMSFDLTPAGGEVDAISTALRVRHARTQQLRVYLKSPNATKVPLSLGETRGENLGTGDCVTGNTSPTTYTGFRDASSQPLTSGSAPYVGYWTPHAPLSAFVGTPMSGVWKLIVKDTRGGAAGKLKCGNLQITDSPG